MSNNERSVVIAFLTGCFLLALGMLYAWAQAQRIPSDSSGTRVGWEFSANGTTAAVAVTAPAIQGRSNYICGFDFFMTNATAANPATVVTVTGLVNTMTYGYPTLATGAAIPNSPHLTIAFSPCQPASAENIAIVVQGPTPGAGATFTSINSWGYSDVPF